MFKIVNSFIFLLIMLISGKALHPALGIKNNDEKSDEDSSSEDYDYKTYDYGTHHQTHKNNTEEGPPKSFFYVEKILTEFICLRNCTANNQTEYEKRWCCPPVCERRFSLPFYEDSSKRISEQKCEEYVWEMNGRLQKEYLEKACVEEADKKGLGIFKKTAVGGWNALQGQFPHMGAIGWKAADDNDWIFMCGSSLISPKFVLTAAHCSHAGDQSWLADPVPKIIRFGYTYLFGKDVSKGFKIRSLGPDTRSIHRIICHPKYKSPKKYNDIALMELNKPLSFSKHIQPACLWPRYSTEPIGKKANATGWGAVKLHSRENSPNLQAVTIDIFEFEKCANLLKPFYNDHWPHLHNTQMCAGKLSGGVDTCQGDSGGPLQVRIPFNEKNEGDMHYVIGVTSFGYKCGLNNTPGVYTRVTPYLDWIESIVWKYPENRNVFYEVVKFTEHSKIFGYSVSCALNTCGICGACPVAPGHGTCPGVTGQVPGEKGVFSYKKYLNPYTGRKFKEYSHIISITEPLSHNIFCDSRYTTEENITKKENYRWCPESCERTVFPKPEYAAPGKRISEQKCEEYIWEINDKIHEKKNDKDCLRDATNGKYLMEFQAALGGRDVEEGEFPHMGGIGWKTVFGNWIFLCGSSLISPKFVLTAAHCCHAGDDTRLEDPAPKIVRFGNRNIKIDGPLRTKNFIKIDKTHTWFVVNKNIIKIITHDDYKPLEKYNDIALMELDGPVKFGEKIRPACLWPRFTTDLIGSKVTATGWGVVETHSSDNSAILQVINIDIIDFSKCGQLLQSHTVRNWSGRLRNTQICAGKLSGGVDTCQGDSGGPLQAEIPLNDKSQGHMHYVIGVTSFGVGCGLNNTPGVYTRVAPYLDWIESHVWKK